MDGVDTWFEKCIYKVNPNPTVVTKMMPFNMVLETKPFLLSISYWKQSLILKIVMLFILLTKLRKVCR